MRGKADWTGPRPFGALSTRNKKSLRNEIQSKKGEKQERKRAKNTVLGGSTLE